MHFQLVPAENISRKESLNNRTTKNSMLAQSLHLSECPGHARHYCLGIMKIAIFAASWTFPRELTHVVVHKQ